MYCPCIFRSILPLLSVPLVYSHFYFLLMYQHWSAGSVCIQALYKIITVPADVLAPTGARPSADTVVTSKVNMLHFGDFEYGFKLISWYFKMNDDISQQFIAFPGLHASDWLNSIPILLVSHVTATSITNTFSETNIEFRTQIRKDIFVKCYFSYS